MFVIHTNLNNPAALKLLIGARKAGKEISLKILNGASKRLPYLELENGASLHSTNAALKYLMGETWDNNKSDRWLELEAELASSLGTKNPKLKTILKTIDEGLNNDYINGSSISSGDVALFATLYPLFMDPNSLKEHFDVLPKVAKWMKQLSSDSVISTCLNEFKIEAATAYQALQAGGKFIASGMSNVEIKPENVESVTAEEITAAKLAFAKTIGNLPKRKKDKHPILPVKGEKNVLITSALPYVNNVPHLGNIIGCVLSSDVFARFSRLCNWNTLFIGGTDEYGTATETKALEEGLTPQQICDKYFDVHNSIYRWFNIGFDFFGRTTAPEQTKLVQEMFVTLNDNGFMQTQPVEQLLCQKCDRYLADRFVEGGCPHPGCGYEDARGDQCDKCGKLVNATELRDPRCKVCGSSPVVRISKQFFLDLPQLEPLLRVWMEKSTVNWTNNAKVITKSWMKEGLKARCITRDLKWGVPVPIDGYKDKVFYVWFDAPLGYISMTTKYTKDWEKWWKPQTDTQITLYQFMAKDNVPFHSVMFPACLLGARGNYTLVSHIMATEYLNYEDGKFSKSRGVGVFGTDAQSTGIPSDVWRFYLLFIRPEGQDSSFSWADLATKNNSELLNNLGNFVNRALVFTEKFFDGKVPEMSPTEEDFTLLAHCTRELKSYVAALEKGKLRDGVRHILAISKHGNQYMQSTQPWVLLKGDEQQKQRAGTVIGISVNIACLLATLMFPYMPEASRNLKSQMNAGEETSILTPDDPQIVTLLKSGHKIGKPAPLFAKIEPAFVEEMRQKFGGSQKEKSPPGGAGGDVSGSVEALEKAISAQGDKVRALKGSGASKATWQPEVTLLLELKKKLETAQKATTPVDSVQALEKAVSAQGEKVRALKAGGANKTTWQPEVTVLLELKKKLEAAQKSGAPTPSTNGQVAGSSAEDIKSVETEIEKQALLVRKLKESGAPKTEWQPQVDTLLKLKAKLGVMTGKPLAAPGKKGMKEAMDSREIQVRRHVS